MERGITIIVKTLVGATLWTVIITGLIAVNAFLFVGLDVVNLQLVALASFVICAILLAVDHSGDQKDEKATPAARSTRYP